MSSYAVTLDGARIGTVARFAGETPARRWVAYSVHSEERPGFPTRRQAEGWLQQQAAAAKDRPA